MASSSSSSSCVIQSEKLKVIESVCAVIVKGSHWDKLLKPLIHLNLLTDSIINQVLLHFKSNSIISWSFFKFIESPSLQCSWSMIHILTHHHHYQLAQNHFYKIALQHQHLFSSPSLLNSLISTIYDPVANSHILSWLIIFYSNSNMTHDAIQVFEHMRVSRFTPHLHSCTALLNSLVKNGMTHMVWRLYKQMVVLGVVPNHHVYNVLIHACCKSRDVEKAEELLSEMELKYSVFPDLFTFNTLISLYCKKGMHYQALCVQDRMEKGGVKPDIVTYNSLIYGFCRQGRMREAVNLFNEIKGVNPPNHVTYTTLIDGHCRANDLDEALRLRHVMETDHGLYPGVVTYNSILRKLCQDGRIREANKLLKEMSEKKVEPDSVTCNTLINAYAKIGDMDSALKVKNKMLESGLKMDQYTYRALIHGFCKAREMDNAKEHLFSMLNAGFSPSYCTYSWIVDSYCSRGNEEAVSRLADEFVNRGIFADISVYRAIIRRLCQKDKVDSAKTIFDRMQEKGIKGDSVVYTNLAYAYFREGNAGAGLEMLDEMVKRKLMITFKLYTSCCLNDAQEKSSSISTTFGIFWDHVTEKGLISKNTLRYIQTSESLP